MSILLVIAAALVVLVLAMVLVGARLPRDHVASRSATLARPPDQVWPAMLVVAARSKLPVAVEVEDPPRRRVTRISDESLPFGGRWIFELEPTNGATRVTVTEQGFVKNPLFRFLSRFVFGHTAGIERFLADLAKQL
jgi:hypothetical protein